MTQTQPLLATVLPPVSPSFPADAGQGGDPAGFLAQMAQDMPPVERGADDMVAEDAPVMMVFTLPAPAIMLAEALLERGAVLELMAERLPDSALTAGFPQPTEPVEVSARPAAVVSLLPVAQGDDPEITVSDDVTVPLAEPPAQGIEGQASFALPLHTPPPASVDMPERYPADQKPVSGEGPLWTGRFPTGPVPSAMTETAGTDTGPKATENAYTETVFIRSDIGKAPENPPDAPVAVRVSEPAVTEKMPEPARAVERSIRASEPVVAEKDGKTLPEVAVPWATVPPGKSDQSGEQGVALPKAAREVDALPTPSAMVVEGADRKPPKDKSAPFLPLPIAARNGPLGATSHHVPAAELPLPDAVPLTDVSALIPLPAVRAGVVADTVEAALPAVAQPSMSPEERAWRAIRPVERIESANTETELAEAVSGAVSDPGEAEVQPRPAAPEPALRVGEKAEPSSPGVAANTISGAINAPASGPPGLGSLPDGIMVPLPVSASASFRPDPRPDGLPASVPVQVQIVQALGPDAGPVTEMRLSPEELGHVRIDMRHEGDRLVMTVSAERQDTLDLLRRHAGELASDLRAAGHSGLDLSFGRWSGPGTQADAQSGGQVGQDHVPPVLAAPADGLPPATSVPGSGLYLRI